MIDDAAIPSYRLVDRAARTVVLAGALLLTVGASSTVLFGLAGDVESAGVLERRDVQGPGPEITSWDLGGSTLAFPDRTVRSTDETSWHALVRLEESEGRRIEVSGATTVELWRPRNAQQIRGRVASVAPEPTSVGANEGDHRVYRVVVDLDQSQLKSAADGSPRAGDSVWVRISPRGSREGPVVTYLGDWLTALR